MSVTLRLEDDVDVSRGDMICRPHNQPAEAQDARGDGLLDGRAAAASRAAATRIKHTTRTALGDGRRAALPHRRQHAAPRRGGRRRSALNEIGRVRLRLSSPLLVDEYRRNRATGSFILIDEATNDTVGAGMVL